MSETTEKIEPCAWCGEAPFHNTETLTWHHIANECADSRLGMWNKREWNKFQRANLARRRADFDAGWMLRHQGEMLDPVSEQIAEGFAAYLSRPKGDV